MAKNSRTGLSGQALKDANASISRLRKLGLYNGKAARGQPTKYALSLVKKFSSAIEGTAAVVTVPRSEKKSLLEKAGDFLAFKGNKAVVEKNPLNAERARFNKKTKEIEVSGVGEQGKKYTRKVSKASKLTPPKKNTRREFRFHFPAQRKKNGKMGRQGNTPWFDDIKELMKYGHYAKLTNIDQFLETRDVED